MKTFLVFLILSFIGGFYLWDKNPKKRTLLFIGIGTLLAFAYFQINWVI
ncbi:MAG: hypothetical protein KDE09_21015 [Anaerolineales bacterium]|nr:hypothetical protein [Anaerolineales bacterium]MCB8961348.1 hypothetical protein [Ardenticatenales bacterium]MCB0005091.1 hypothetical protein [Anaerolineales bacterium]MCB0010609.1 hypothetical protein [Anaerolineales bacterium]MCB0020292.1 hypothetical protein [Anaerolineales bacterium]